MKYFIKSIIAFFAYLIIILGFAFMYKNNSDDFKFDENLNDEIYLFSKYESENITQKLLEDYYLDDFVFSPQLKYEDSPNIRIENVRIIEFQPRDEYIHFQLDSPNEIDAYKAIWGEEYEFVEFETNQTFKVYFEFDFIDGDTLDSSHHYAWVELYIVDEGVHLAYFTSTYLETITDFIDSDNDFEENVKTCIRSANYYTDFSSKFYNLDYDDYLMYLKFYHEEKIQSENSLNRFVYYSTITASTLGYGDLLPTTNYMRNLVIIESAIGPIILGTFFIFLGFNLNTFIKRN